MTYEEYVAEATRWNAELQDKIVHTFAVPALEILSKEEWEKYNLPGPVSD
jgi:hypothetical protein